MFAVVLLDEILHNAARFEEADSLPVGEGVCQGRDAAIGVDGKEPRFFLRILGDVDCVGCVGKTTVLVSLDERRTNGCEYRPELLKDYGYLNTVGSLVGVEIDFGTSRVGHVGHDLLLQLRKATKHVLSME